MGIFDFIKAAGERLGIGGSPATEDSKDVPPPPSAEAVKAAIEAHGLDVSGVDVAVDGDKVSVTGQAGSNEAREKMILAAGNIAGVASVEETIGVPEGEAESTFYTVKKGDSLWKIAAAHYGNGSKYTAIFEANKPLLKDPDKIYPGQNLRIPPL
ncbi:peptidoglycan-binding protein LysM [Zavarzinia compransoris]|uniref:peptidoglycan-binding protein LysM n=1 Tax=Zavarzinia marina TaxID=2911065 RepID=UPI001F1D44F9|nr:peptidoglycan-binding protein LysM [Zavarzinia marina]MCF4166885.1 peptidoglycan-binding protein LysM [Zavarzinia marina]